MRITQAAPEQASSLGRVTRRFLQLSAVDSRLALRLLTAAWVLTRAVLLAGVVIGHQYCDPEFYKYAGLLSAGKLPYRDYTVEYPPVTIMLLLLPAVPLLAFAQVAPRPDPAFAPGYTQLPSPNPVRWGAYGLSFAFEMLVIDALTLWLVRRSARRFVPTDPQGLYSGLLYIGLMFLSGSLLQKFDLIQGTLSLLGVFALTQRRPRVAWSALSAATLVKGFPMLAAPILVGIYFAHRTRSSLFTELRYRARPLINGVLTFAAVIVTITLTIVLYAGWRPVWNTLAYHADRGAEIESLYANVMLVVGWLPGLRPWDIFNPADLSREVRGPLAGFATPASVAMLFMLLAFVYAAAWRALTRLRARGLVLSVGAFQPALVATAAVLIAFELSFLALPGHYLLVVLPLVAVIRLPSVRAQSALLVTVVCVALFGQVLVNSNVWMSLRALAPGAVILLSIRNMAWVLACATLIVALWRWPEAHRQSSSLE